MILDKLENAASYKGISENLRKGFEYLISTDLNLTEQGKYEIDGKNVYAIVSEYLTKIPQECKLEAHHQYIDIQYIVAGHESIGYVALANQDVTSEYNPDKDVAFFQGEVATLALEPGMFAVFFPQDLHQPCMQTDGPAMVKKVVVKVKL